MNDKVIEAEYTDVDGDRIKVRVSPSTALQLVQGLTARLEEWVADDAERE